LEGEEQGWREKSRVGGRRVRLREKSRVEGRRVGLKGED